ncbi:MAG: glycosyltransferase family 4 protein [Campylobacteraceae bacterium]
MKKKLFICITTPASIQTWFKNQPKFLSQFYDVEIFTSFSNNLQELEKNENVKINVIDFTRNINPLKDLIIFIKLTIIFIKKKPNIVYSLTPKSGLIAMLSAFTARVKNRFHVVVGLPLIEAKGVKKLILNITERLTYICSNHLYCNSINLANYLSKTLTNKKVNIIWNGSVNGIDLNFYKNTLDFTKKKELCNKLALNDKNFIFIYIGRLVKDKGIQELIVSFEKLNTLYKNIKLILLGDYEQNLDPIEEKYLDTISLNNNIIKVAFQNDIRDYLSIANTLVLPSYREGLPNILLEAGAFGLPMIATNINGCNEVIINNENGLLVEPKNADSLYIAMYNMFNDKVLYQKLKNNSRNSIEDRYEQYKFWEFLHKELEIIKESNDEKNF